MIDWDEYGWKDFKKEKFGEKVRGFSEENSEENEDDDLSEDSEGLELQEDFDTDEEIL